MVIWKYKLRNSKSCITGYLLRFLGHRIHQARCSSMVPHHIAGVDNIMTDVISCAFKEDKYFKISHDLVSYFNTNFPLAQNESWHKCHVPTGLLSSVIACLRGKLLPMSSLLRQTQQERSTGPNGNDTPPRQASTCSSPASLPANVTLSQEHLLLGSGQGILETEIQSRLWESQIPLRPYPRPLSWLDNQAPSTAQKKSTSYISNASSKDSGV